MVRFSILCFWKSDIQIVKEFVFMAPESSFPCSQNLVTGAHSVQFESMPQLHTLFLQNSFWYFGL
jgi:hypothetical protein